MGSVGCQTSSKVEVSGFYYVMIHVSGKIVHSLGIFRQHLSERSITFMNGTRVGGDDGRTKHGTLTSECGVYILSPICG